MSRSSLESIETSPDASHFIDEARHAGEILARGYTIIPNALPPWLVDGLIEAVARVEANYKAPPADSNPGFRNMAGGATFRVHDLLNRDMFFQRAFEFDPVLALVESLLGSDMLLYSCQTLYVGLGERKQPLHVDDMLTIPQLARPHPPILVNTIWALSDFTDENGATRLVPNSHAWADAPRKTLEEIAANPLDMDTACAEMKRGSILAYDGALWHGAGANHTQQRRLGVIVSYSVGWVRQQENYQLSLPLPLVQTFTPRLQRLCGFGLYRGILGSINGVSPMQALLSRLPAS